MTLHNPQVVPLDAITAETTLVEAKDYLLARMDEGVVCPCCTQFAKVYRWSLYSTAVRALILYYRLGGTSEFVHSNRLKDYDYKGQGDASRLRHWDLVEEEKTRRDDGGRSGYWRVTELGERFIRETASIPRYIYIFDGLVVGRSPEMATIHDAIRTRFNYDEMMEGL